MRHYTKQDCDQTESGGSLRGRVVVLSEPALPDDHAGQLFFCIGEIGEVPKPMDDTVLLVSLYTGEKYCLRRGDVIGILKQGPELLSEEAKLQLSQIRPAGAKDLKIHKPEFSGYSFLPDGRYTTGVWLCSIQEAMDYVAMQKPYQYRVLICDRDDFAVMEVVNGQIIFPESEDLEKLQKKLTPGGGITMT
ncbi:hypothetical protein [Hungatella hathewayi]